MVSLNPHLGNRQNARKPGRNIAKNLEFWMGPVAQLLQNRDLQIRTDACSTPSACSPAPLNTQRRRQCCFLLQTRSNVDSRTCSVRDSRAFRLRSNRGGSARPERGRVAACEFGGGNRGTTDQLLEGVGHAVVAVVAMQLAHGDQV